MNTAKVILAPNQLRIWGVEVEFRAFRDLWLNGSPGCFGPVNKESPLSKPRIKKIIRFGVRIVFSTKTLRTGRSTEHSCSPALLLSCSPTDSFYGKWRCIFLCLWYPQSKNLPLKCESKFKLPYKTNGNTVSYMMFPNLLAVSDSYVPLRFFDL
jgi:hypothetical protein